MMLIDTSYTSKVLPSTKENPLGVSPELQAALDRQSREQLAYEIPVDLSQCSEEEKEFWLIKRANIRNGGRPRENPIARDLVLSPEEYKDTDGNWIKDVPDKLNEQELAIWHEFNALCDQHIVTDHLSQNHRLRFLIGCKFDMNSAMEYLITSERHRYEIGCETLTGEEVYSYEHRAHAIIGLDKDKRPVVYSRCTMWNLGSIPLEQ